MPNWCNNGATITSADKDVLDIIRKTIYHGKDGDFDDGYVWNFLKLIPIVENAKGNGTFDEYDYDKAVSTYETKSGLGLVNDYDNISDNQIYVVFDTAWNPPLGFYRELAKKYDVSISAWYEECGQGFHGEYECIHDSGNPEGVKVIVDATYDIEDDDEISDFDDDDDDDDDDD